MKIVCIPSNHYIAPLCTRLIPVDFEVRNLKNAHDVAVRCALADEEGTDALRKAATVIDHPSTGVYLSVGGQSGVRLGRTVCSTQPGM